MVSRKCLIGLLIKHDPIIGCDTINSNEQGMNLDVEPHGTIGCDMLPGLWL